MQAAQIATVCDRFCYIGLTHNLIVTEEEQNACKDSQRIMTASLTGMEEVPPPPHPFSLKRHICPFPASLASTISRSHYSCLLDLDPRPQDSAQCSGPQYCQGHYNCTILHSGLSLVLFFAMQWIINRSRYTVVR